MENKITTVTVQTKPSSCNFLPSKYTTLDVNHWFAGEKGSLMEP